MTETTEMTRTRSSELSERSEMRKVYVPKVDIIETGDDIVLLADMPGVDENSVDITLEQNVLTINGYVQAQMGDGYKLAYAEYTPGNYQRTFNLADGVDQENIEAIMKNGVLRLVLPKSAAVKARKIAVKSDQ